MLPWAQAEFQLSTLALKGQEAFAFSRTLRDRIDVILEHLNVKKASREAIVLLLVNLPAFVQHSQEQIWPNWLKKKGYFQEGLLFFQICQEALGGSPTTAPARVQVSAAPEARQGRAVKAKKSSHPRPEGRTPSFTGRKGGIFGLKK
jgi:hypothetical protein